MKLIVGNLKMYFDGSEIVNYLNGVKCNDNVIILPSSIHIPYFLNKGFNIGVQNIGLSNVTGEISALQVKKLGISYVLLGHSERKNVLFESNSYINLKVKESLKNGLNVILCVGESLDDRNNNLTKDVIKRQLDECLNGINDSVIIAYEPVWAIGSGNVPSNDEISDIISFIKDLYPYRVLYGGSVNNNNIAELEKCPVLDGYLIGKASSCVSDFNGIIDCVYKK